MTTELIKMFEPPYVKIRKKPSNKFVFLFFYFFFAKEINNALNHAADNIGQNQIIVN